MDEEMHGAPPWLQLPPEWVAPDGQALGRGVGRTRSALRSIDPERLGSMLDNDSPLLEWLPPSHKDEVRPADVLSAVLASGTIPAHAVHRLLAPNPERSAVHSALRSLEPTDLYLSDAVTLSRMERLLVDVTIALAGTESDRRFAIANALCARLRPSLFPIPSSALHHAVGMPASSSHRATWVLLRHVLQDDGVRAELYRLEDHMYARGPAHAGWSELRLVQLALVASVE
ncbi:DUF6308 family protein [Georgenia phoenicis]|uniref:DUF6308 family protein n=1 Tax=unclassified Georgenia TaxID=2626815 RepID=UPI0039AEFB32